MIVFIWTSSWQGYLSHCADNKKLLFHLDHGEQILTFQFLPHSIILIYPLFWKYCVFQHCIKIKYYSITIFSCGILLFNLYSYFAPSHVIYDVIEHLSVYILCPVNVQIWLNAYNKMTGKLLLSLRARLISWWAMWSFSRFHFS